MKKILFHLHCLRKGGAERVVVNLAEMFSADDYQVVIAIEHKAKDDYQISDKIQKVYVGLEKGEESGRIHNFVRRIQKLRKLIQIEKPDIVIAFAKAPNYRALMAVKGLKIPVIVSVRNDPKMHYSGMSSGIMNKLFLENAAGCVFQTEEAKNFFSPKLQKKSTVILNPIHSKYLEVTPVEYRKKYIVHVGRMAEQKNQLMLIKAFEKLSKELPEYELRIYGGETEDGTKVLLETYIQEHDLQSKVQLMGISDHLETEIADASVFVLSSNYEGMPNVLMEAMAMGIPVVSTDCPCGGPKTIIKQKENGILVPVGDVEGMTKAIRDILQDEGYARRLSKKALEIRKDANIDKIYREWREYVKI